MEFKQLEMFLAVADARSVQRAAERVFRSQPAVSMAIAKLEQEVGTTLFARSDGFRLTEAGSVLYRYASELIRIRDEAECAVQATTNRATGGRLVENR